MTVYSDGAARELSLMFNGENDPRTMDWVTLGLYKDYALMQYQYFLNHAYIIAGRLDIEPTWFEMALASVIERCKQSYQKWIAGKASAADMESAMNYAMYTADVWAEELQLINRIVEEKKAADKKKEALPGALQDTGALPCSNTL